MIQNWLKYFKGSVIAKNFLALGSLQIINFLLPLIITPYLINVLGIENFGLVSLSQAVISFFIIITDYGFNLTATRDLALHKSDSKAVETLFREVFSTKLLLLAIGGILLLASVHTFAISQLHRQLYIFAYTLAIGQVLLPVWFFQGIEDMKYITYFSVIAKILAAGTIIVLINETEDFIFVNLINGVSTIVAGALSLFFLYRKYKITLKLTEIQTITKQLRSGWHIFISNFTINIYIVSNVIVLGFFSSSVMVGYYSIAEKIVNAIRQILVVYFQVTYPHVCKIAFEAKHIIYNFIKKAYIPFLIIISIVCAGIFFLAEPIVLFFTSERNEYVQLLVKILSFVPIIVALNIPANQLLLAYNIRKQYSYVLILGSCLNLLVNSVLSFYIDALGTAMAVILTEVFITGGLYIVLKKKKLNSVMFYKEEASLMPL